jgi:hypothetical protein
MRSKNRFRGAGAGKVGGAKNATEEENEAVLGKKEAAYAAACGENGGGYHFRGITKMVRGRAGRRCRTGK